MMLAVIRLLIIHLFASLAIWLSTYIVGLDVVLSLVYLVLISVEISSLRAESFNTKWLTAILWLGIPLTLSVMTSLKISNLTIFLLEFWYTPVLPILSLKAYVFTSGRPLYYYILIWLPVILGIHFLVLTRKRNVINK